MDSRIVRRLVDAHEEVSEALRKGRPRNAARILCRELGWLLEQSEYWDTIRSAADRVEQGATVDFSDLARLLRDEERIFSNLDIDSNSSILIIANVCDAIDDAEHASSEIRFQALKDLRDRVQEAKDLICTQRSAAVSTSEIAMAACAGLAFIDALAVGAADGSTDPIDLTSMVVAAIKGGRALLSLKKLWGRD